MQYSFRPTGTDPDGDVLTYAIEGMPAWASFDTATGSLTGTPSMQHLGNYPEILISVSDAESSTDLAGFDIEVVQVGTSSVSLTWTPPTLSADGGPLNDLAGYRVRWGTQTGDYPNSVDVENASASRFVIDGLAPGTYYFTISAIDTSNNESSPSNEASGVAP